MPSGKTHDKISIGFLPILLVILYFIEINMIGMIIISISFLFASFMFNGDLDLYSLPYKRWGPLKFIWKPYQNIPHRSILSHGLIIGTIIRLVYLLFIPFLFVFFGHYDISFLYDIKTLYILIGLECGSALHTISDKLF